MHGPNLGPHPGKCTFRAPQIEWCSGASVGGRKSGKVTQRFQLLECVRCGPRFVDFEPTNFQRGSLQGRASSPLQRRVVAPMHAPRTASNSMSRRIGPPDFLGPPTIAPMPMGRKHGRLSSPSTCPRFPPLAPLKARCEPWLVCGLESRRPCASLLPSTLHTHNRRARGRPRL